MGADRTKTNIKRGVLVLLIFFLQYIFADKLRIFGVAPNIAFAFITALAFLQDFKFNITASLILGFLLDAVSGRIFGIHMLMFVSMNFLIQELYHSAFSDNFVMQTIYGLLSAFVYSVIFAFFNSFFKGNFFVYFTQIGLIEFIYNFLLFELFLIIQKNTHKKRRGAFRL